MLGKTDQETGNLLAYVEAPRRFNSNLSNRNKDVIRIGMWNIRTLMSRELGSVEEMNKYKLEIGGMSEARLKGNGVKIIGNVTSVYS